MRNPARHRASLFLALAALLSCDGPPGTGPEPKPAPPVQLQVVSGDGQKGTVESPLPAPLVVRVLDASGKGVRGVSVSWAVGQGAGTLSATSTPTDSAGEARTEWTLGPATGTFSASASVEGLPTATFSATASFPPPARIERVSGDAQSATVGTPLADSLVVRVLSAGGRPVPGVPVTWTIAAGGGTLSASGGTTDAAGLAKVRWTLGATAGEQRVEARSGELAGSPVVFRATGKEGAAAGLSRVSGDAQSGAVGTALASPLVVRVTDTHGNPVAGASVTWMVTAGGGSVSPGIATSDSAGLARATWTLGTAPGTGTVSATGGGGAVAFSATATPGALAALTSVEGNEQTGRVGTALATPLGVRATDRYGNPLAGVSVTWAVTAGGGSVSPSTSATDASGIARTRWTLGPTAGTNTATASATGAAAVTFTATAVADPPPSELRLEVNGRLERGLEVELKVTENGVAVPATSVTFTADPAGSVEILSGGRARLLQAGTVRITATVSGRSTSTSVQVARPPWIVFDLARDGNRDIYVAALDGGDLRRLTTHPAEDRDPTVAGSVVVFTSNRDGNAELYSIPLQGGAETRLTSTTTAELEPALSPDGRRLAFVSDAGGTHKLWVSAADGTGAARATTLGTAGTLEGSPSWAPGSDRLAFMTTHLGSADIWVYPVGGEPTSLAASSRADVEPAWSPDGRQVAFVSNRDGDTEIYLVQVDTREVRRLTHREGTDARPAWLPDGRLVYLAFTGSTPALRWVDPAVPAVTHAIPVGAGTPGTVEGVR